MFASKEVLAVTASPSPDSTPLQDDQVVLSSKLDAQEDTSKSPANSGRTWIDGGV